MFGTPLLASKRLLLISLLLVVSVSLASPAFAQGSAPFAKITAQNAAQLTWQRGVSNGTLVNATWSADGKSMFVVTHAGVYRYDSADLAKPPILISGDFVPTSAAYFSPDRQWLATSIASGGKLRLTKLATGEFWTAMEELKNSWYKIQFSSEMVVALSYANRLWIYDLRQKRVVRTIEGVYDIAIRPDGKQLAITDSRGIALWDTATIQAVSRVGKRIQYSYNMRYSGDGKTLYNFASGSFLYAFDVETGKQKYELSAAGYGMITMDAQAKTALLWGTSANTPFVQLVNLETGKRLFNLRVTDSVQEYTSPVYAADLSPDGKRAVSLSWNNKLRVWDTASGQLIRERTVSDSIFVAFSPDGKKLLLNSASEVLTYDYAADHIDAVAGYYGRNTADIGFSPDGQLLSTAGDDYVARLWKVGDWDHVTTLRPSKSATVIYQTSYSPDSQTLLLNADDASWLYKLDNLGKTAPTAKDFTKLNTPTCQQTAYSPNGKLIACNLSTSIIVLDAVTKRVVWDYGKLLDKDNPIYFSSMTFSSDDKYLVIAPYIYRLDILELATLTLTTHDLDLTQSIYAIASSPDSKWLAATDADNAVHVYDMKTTKEVWSVRGLARSNRGGRSFVTFSPDGSLIAAPDLGRAVRLFEAATGKVVAELQSNSDGEGNYDINGIAFSPDGTLLAGTTSLGVVGLWAVTP